MISLLITEGCRNKNNTPSISDNEVCDYESVDVENVDVFEITDTCAADTIIFEESH